MDLVQSILNPSKPLLASAAIVGVLIALGLVANNSNPLDNIGISALGADTTVVGPFSNEELRDMFNQWALDFKSSGLGGGFSSVAASHVYGSVRLQVPLYGNQLSATEPLFDGFGAQNIVTLTTSYGYGWYVSLFTIDSNGENQPAIFKVVRQTDPTFTYTPTHFSTTPLQYKLVGIVN